MGQSIQTGEGQGFLCDLLSLALDGAAGGDLRGRFHHARQPRLFHRGDSIHLAGIPTPDGGVAHLPCMGFALNFARQNTSIG
jgi:hypothetical protein